MPPYAVVDASRRAGQHRIDMTADAGVSVRRLLAGTVAVVLFVANLQVATSEAGAQDSSPPGGATPPSGANTYSYDNRGNRTTFTPNGGATVTYTYDQANRLTAVSGPTAASYAYNGDGLRTAKTVSGTTKQFTWSHGGGLPMVLNDGTNAYVYGPDGVPLEHVNAGNPTYYHHDQLGSTRSLTDASGNVTGTATYNPYGTLNAHTGTLSPLGYAGQYTDAETGLQYLRARYYDPTTTQFLTRDPIAATTRSNYAYVNGNPTNATDPSGLCGPLCGAAIGAVIEAGSQTWQRASAGCDTGLDNINWTDVGTAAAIGGGAGFASRLLSGSRAAPKVTTRGTEVATETGAGLVDDVGHAGIHQFPGVTAGKSQFFDGANLGRLADTGDLAGVVQKNGNIRYVLRGAGDVGIDRTTGLPTDIYTVIRKPDGSVLTMFPGTSPMS
jgi:RHS repeat-associated protein